MCPRCCFKGLANYAHIVSNSERSYVCAFDGTIPALVTLVKGYGNVQLWRYLVSGIFKNKKKTEKTKTLAIRDFGYSKKP